MRNMISLAALMTAAFCVDNAHAGDDSVADLADGRVCPVTLDGTRSGILQFNKQGGGLMVQIYRNPKTVASYQKIVSAAQPLAAIQQEKTTMENQGAHPVTIKDGRLKFDNGRGAYPDLALSPDGTTISGAAAVPGSSVIFKGVCYKQ